MAFTAVEQTADCSHCRLELHKPHIKKIRATPLLFSRLLNGPYYSHFQIYQIQFGLSTSYDKQRWFD